MISDARTRYTKMVIKNSFVKLLKDKPINKVTVKNICELAEINRATFYRYYYDAFNLMEQIEKESIAELQSFIQASEFQKISDVFMQMLNKIKEDGKLYMILFSEHGDAKFPQKILDVCYEKTSLFVERDFSKLSKEKQKWLYYFLSHGCSGILNCWINNGMKETPLEVSQFIEELCVETVNAVK